jgi:Ran-binding protein 3
LVNKVGVGANDTKPKLETGENSQEVSNSTNKDAEETSKNPLNHSSNDFSNKSNKILEAPKDATKVSNEQKSEHDGGEHAKSAVPKNAEDSTSGEASKSDESQPSAEKTAKIFGTGTSFGSKTLDSFTEKKDESDDVTKNGSATSGLASSGSGTKFGSSAIFGSGTSFGTRSLSNWASASGSSDQSGSTSIFGSGSTSSLAKPSVNIFDTVSNDKEEGAEDVKEDKNEEDASVNEDLYVKVAAPLEQRSVETGEEQEDSVFSCRVRLYALDLTNAAVGWKERGTGTLHVNKMRDGSRSRLVMRADAVLRVILNLPLVQNMEVAQGMKSSLASDKFVRITGFEDKKPHQYALKAANPELAQELFNHINELVVTS